MNFILKTAFAASHRFCKVVFYCRLSWGVFWFPLWFHCSVTGFFSSMLFSLHVIVFFPFFFLWLISSFIPLWSEKMLEITSIPLNLLKLVLCLSMWSILENVPCTVEKNVYSAFLGCSVLLISIKSSCPIVSFSICCLINFLSERSFCWCQWGVKVFYFYCIPVNFSL